MENYPIRIEKCRDTLSLCCTFRICEAFVLAEKLKTAWLLKRTMPKAYTVQFWFANGMRRMYLVFKNVVIFRVDFDAFLKWFLLICFYILMLFGHTYTV